MTEARSILVRFLVLGISLPFFWEQHPDFLLRVYPSFILRPYPPNKPSTCCRVEHICNQRPSNQDVEFTRHMIYTGPIRSNKRTLAGIIRKQDFFSSWTRTPVAILPQCGKSSEDGAYKGQAEERALFNAPGSSYSWGQHPLSLLVTWVDEDINPPFCTSHSLGWDFLTHNRKFPIWHQILQEDWSNSPLLH